MSNSLEEQYAQTPLYGGNAGAVEALYEQYLQQPDSVPAAWRTYFNSLGSIEDEVSHAAIRAELLESAKSGSRKRTVRRSGSAKAVSAGEKQAAVSRLIQVYSLRGHQIADIDPLGMMARPMPGVLKFDYLGLSDADMDSEFYTGGLAGTGNRLMQLRDILALLQTIYSGKIGAEFAHISRTRERLWLRKRFEQGMASSTLSDAERLLILEQLTSVIIRLGHAGPSQ